MRCDQLDQSADIGVDFLLCNFVNKRFFFIDIFRFLDKFIMTEVPVINVLGEFDERKHKSRHCILHAFRSALNENFLELHEKVIVNVVASGVSHHVHKPRNALLSLLQLEGFFFSSLLVIAEKWFDKFKQLFDSLLRVELVVVLNHGFADAQCNSALVGELHVVHQRGIVMHL